MSFASIDLFVAIKASLLVNKWRNLNRLTMSTCSRGMALSIITVAFNFIEIDADLSVETGHLASICENDDIHFVKEDFCYPNSAIDYRFVESTKSHLI